ncbi:hypothetical protein BH23PLA1_BH23PLA1_30550 [soil metagenome]
MIARQADRFAKDQDRSPALDSNGTSARSTRFSNRDRGRSRSCWKTRLEVESLDARVLLTTTLPAGFNEAPFALGVTNPTAMAFAPDGRLFVAEQGGTLRVIRDGQLLSAPALTLDVDSRGERGLLGVAFDPADDLSRFVYVYYTVASTPAQNRLSRFELADDAAVPGSEQVLLDLEPLTNATNHNGGGIHFGLDGRIYVGVGENAVLEHSQTLDNKLGKLLRLNPDGSIPNDNPFFHVASGTNRAIWALGLRNPFTFAVQPGTGRIFINDVGGGGFEEINEGIAGANYGWPVTEGPTDDPRFVGPLFAYPNQANTAAEGEPRGCAISGGTFYNPDVLLFPAEFEGAYFFADFCGGFLWRLDLDDDGSATEFASGMPFGTVDLTVGPDGALYYLSRSGRGVFRIAPDPAEPPPPEPPPPPPELSPPLDNRDEAFIRALYRDVLGREADVEGLNTWIEQIESGANREFVASGFLESVEGRTRFINETYAALLGRAPEPGALEFWVARMEDGESRDGFQVAVLGSDEYQVRQGGAGGPFIRGLYQDVLSRPAGDDEVEFWADRLSSTPRAEVASAIADSEEARDRWIADLYENLFDREADVSERAFWSGQLREGLPRGRLAPLFLSSAEYFARA